MSRDSENNGFDTRAIRGGQRRTNEGEQDEPIFTTSSFVFADSAQAAARFSGAEDGNIYSRFTNPTVQTFERRLAGLEGGERCVATASGMAAILTTCMGLLSAGDHIVSSRTLFGPTVKLLRDILSRFGVETSFVSLVDIDAWRQAIRPSTRMLFLETPSNPLLEVADIAALAELAHQHDCLLVVDNCLSTPALQKPLDLGADIIVHSATKYIDGHGRCVGGAIIGKESLVGDGIYTFLRTAGPSMSPFNAWVFLKGMETLSLRMKAHSSSAFELARYLSDKSSIKKVYYPGLEAHPQHRLAASQQSAFGGMVSFELQGGKAAAWKFIDATQMISITANLGDAKSTITHPATTTHSRLTAAERAVAGISDSLVRVSVGLENIEDIKADLERGFAALAG